LNTLSSNFITTLRKIVLDDGLSDAL